MNNQLTKPQFVKVRDLENGKSGYNVYVKVVSVEKSQTQSNVPIVRAVVADQTGCANAFFKGESSALVDVGNVIAIRNGTINFIKSHISLQVDIFGRITPQNFDIKTDTTNNISQKEVQRKQRRHQTRGDDRRPKKQGYDRRPRREGEDRMPRRQGDEKRHRKYSEDRKPRREGDFDRRPRKEGQGYKQRREGEERGPRREDNRGDRRPPIKFSKISSIEPGDEGINFFAKVLKVESVGKKARVALGDQTAIVKAFLFEGEHIKVGETIVLFGAEARVIKQRIEIQVPKDGKVDKARRQIQEVNEEQDMSAKEWVEAVN